MSSNNYIISTNIIASKNNICIPYIVANGNDLLRETDARGNKSVNTVNAETSRNEEVTDRLGNKTAYEYDKAGRTTKVTSKNASGTALAAVCKKIDK